MTSLSSSLDNYLRLLEQHGSLTPKVIIGLRSETDWSSTKWPDEVTPFDDLKIYFSRISGYDNSKCAELGLHSPTLAWGMYALSIEQCIRHHENASFAFSDDNPDYWPLEFFPFMRDDGGSYLVVNCDASSPKYGAVYDMCDGVGCNRVSNSLADFFEASALEIVQGLRTYVKGRSTISVDPKEYLLRAAGIFGHSPYFDRIGKMGTQIVDWK